MNKPFAIADVSTGVLNALVKKIMRQTGTHDAEEAIRLVTSGEWLVKKPRREWCEKDGIIYLEVRSVTGMFPGWLRWCEKHAIGLHGSATDILTSSSAEPTRNTTYKIAILKQSKHLPTVGHIRDEALRREWLQPPIEAACLIREKFSDWEIQAMGISWIMLMHKPAVTDGIPAVLSIYSSQEYENFIWVNPDADNSEVTHANMGYAYMVSESTPATV